MQRVLFFFLKSEEDTIALGEDDEGELKRIYQMKDKDGILIGIALREKLLSVMLFMAHFFFNLFAFSKYHHKRRDIFQHFIMKNFKYISEKLKEFYTECHTHYLYLYSKINILLYLHLCTPQFICQSILIFGCISKSIIDISKALCKYISMPA